MTKLQILGTGCPKCRLLTERAETAARELGIGYELEKVTDISEITKFNIMMTPALAVNGAVMCSGHVPSVEEIKRLIG